MLVCMDISISLRILEHLNEPNKRNGVVLELEKLVRRTQSQLSSIISPIKVAQVIDPTVNGKKNLTNKQFFLSNEN